MSDSTGAAAVKVGGCILGVLVLAAAMGGQAQQAVDHTTNDLAKKGALVYGGKKAIDAAAKRLGGGGAPPPVDAGSGSSKDRDKGKGRALKPKSVAEPALADDGSFAQLPALPSTTTPTLCTPHLVPTVGIDGASLTSTC